MNYENLAQQMLLQFSGQASVITIHRPFVEFTGSLEAGVMLSQLLYWTPRANNGWIAKTDKDFHDELCLSEYAIRKARTKLIDMGILTTKIKRFNGTPTTHYKLDMNATIREWTLWIREVQSSNSQSPFLENAESLTENTIENTSENPPAPPSKKGGALQIEKPKSMYIQHMERLEQIFSEERGTPPPDWKTDPKGSMKTWRAPLAQIYGWCGSDIEFSDFIIRKTVKHMLASHLTFSLPTQITKTASSFVADALLTRKKTVTQKSLKEVIDFQRQQGMRNLTLERLYSEMQEQGAIDNANRNAL